MRGGACEGASLFCGNGGEERECGLHDSNNSIFRDIGVR